MVQVTIKRVSKDTGWTDEQVKAIDDKFMETKEFSHAVIHGEAGQLARMTTHELLEPIAINEWSNVDDVSEILNWVLATELTFDNGSRRTYITLYYTKKGERE